MIDRALKSKSATCFRTYLVCSLFIFCAIRVHLWKLVNTLFCKLHKFKYYLANIFLKDIFLTLPGNVGVFYRVCLVVFSQLSVFFQVNFERMRGSLRILARNYPVMKISLPFNFKFITEILSARSL